MLKWNKVDEDNALQLPGSLLTDVAFKGNQLTTYWLEPISVLWKTWRWRSHAAGVVGPRQQTATSYWLKLVERGCFQWKLSTPKSPMAKIVSYISEVKGQIILNYPEKTCTFLFNQWWHTSPGFSSLSWEQRRSQCTHTHTHNLEPKLKHLS